MPIGVGIGRDADGNQLSLRSLYEKGGLEKVVLTGDDVPRSDYNLISGDGTDFKADVWQSYYAMGEPHNNMPPWIAFLMKIKFQ